MALLFSKVFELRGYAAGKFQDRPEWRWWAVVDLRSYGFSSPVTAGQLYLFQSGL